MKPSHRMIWTTIKAHLPDGFHFTLPSSSVSGCVAFPSMTSVHNGMRRTMRNWMRTDHVAMYIPSWAQPCGAPFQFVSVIARIRVATNRIESMGQKPSVPLAFSIAFLMKCHSQPVSSLIVIQIQIIVKMTKNCTVKLITHCMVTEIGGVYCGPLGCSITKTDQITAEMPTYTENIMIQRATVRHV